MVSMTPHAFVSHTEVEEKAHGFSEKSITDWVKGFQLSFVVENGKFLVVTDAGTEDLANAFAPRTLEGVGRRPPPLTTCLPEKVPFSKNWEK